MSAMPTPFIQLASVANFVAQVGTSYLLGRLTAMDGPRVSNLEPQSGDYGVPMPRTFGEAIPVDAQLLAQAKIKETEHDVEDHSGLIGAATGASYGFMLGGPVGAGIGAVVGGLAGMFMPNQHYYTYSVTLASLVSFRLNQDPIEDVPKLWCAGKVIFDKNQSAVISEDLDADGHLIRRKYRGNRYMKSFTVYGGGAEQVSDPILNGAVGQQSGYRRRAYFVIEDWQLADFGNQPQPIRALVQSKTGETLAEVAEMICEAAGIDRVRRLSSTALNDIVVRGYGVLNEVTCWNGLSPLMPVYKVDGAEVAGQIQFYKRSQALQAIIPLKDMAGHPTGTEQPDLIRFTHNTDIDLPRETSITFIDPARDYQPNTATSQRSEGTAKSNVSLNLAINLTAQEGATAAATIHWDKWLGRLDAKFICTEKWIGAQPGRAYGLQAPSGILPYRLGRKLRGRNRLIEFEAVSDESVTYQGTVQGDSGVVPDPDSTEFADTRIAFMDMPIFSDAHDDHGFYVAMSGTEAYWPRGKIEASSDGVTFAKLLDNNGSTVIGDVTGVLGPAPVDVLDEINVLTVVVPHDGIVLSSTTDELLDAWKNFAFVGKDGTGEYIQYKTAVKVAPQTWELSNLLRGRMGTEWGVETHGADEEFVLLGGPGVFRIPYADSSKWGVTLYFRGVTLFQDEADADIVEFTNTGEGKRPKAVVNVNGERDDDNNLAVTFNRRSRLQSVGWADPPLGEASEEYEIDILDGVVVVRTITVNAETFDYSAIDQTADGLVPGDPISGVIYQMSETYGRGRPTEFTV